MDWNLKTPNWDFSEYEQGNIQNIDGVSGSSSSRGDFSVDLKLGHEVFDSGNEFEDSLKETNVSKMRLSSSSSSPSGLTKRARAVGNGVQTPSCLVDGCNVDLSNCREYHRRHKVCEVHSKTAEVTINGNKQRFCQQCSRFHSPEEFDEGKRSCRKRLDGHNRRRRKPQPETLSRSGSLFSTNQGPTMLQFSSPQVYPTTAITNTIWAGLIKPEEDVKFYNNRHTQSHLPESSTSSNKGSSVNQFNLFHSTNLELNNNSHNSRTCQPLLHTITSSETSSNNSTDKMLCDGFPSRDCALSLLSSSSTQTSCMGGPRLVMPPGPNFIPTGHPLDSAAAYSGLEPMESILVHNGAAEGMFHMAPHASSRDNETPQKLPFYWE